MGTDMKKPTTSDIASLFYEMEDIAAILGVSKRSAYNFCNNTKEFTVRKIGRLIRVQKSSFDKWLNE